MTQMPRFGLIGRGAERLTLRSAFERARAGRPAAVLVQGEAGIGKSALVESVSEALAADGALVLPGRCQPLAVGSLGYAPLAGALRCLREQQDWPALREDLRRWLPQLGRLVPALSEGLESEGREPAPEIEKEQLFEIVLSVLRVLSERSPLVLVQEDLHWADQSSLELLTFLARNLRTERLLLVMTYRTEDAAVEPVLRQAMAELCRTRLVRPMELGALDHAELAQLTAAVRGSPLPDGEVALLLERSDGNAYFAEELLAAGAAGLADPPAALRDVVLSRVRMLGEDTQTVLGAAAVAGREVDEPVLSRVCGMTGSRLRGALREAVSHRVLTADAAQRCYRFRHWLAQDAIYRDLLPGELADYHAAAAEALAAQPGRHRDPAAAAEIAHHWDSARRPDRAFAARVEAGRASIGAMAYTEALRHLSRAADLADEMGGGVPEAERAAGLPPGELLVLTADAARWTGDIRRAAALGRQALAAMDVEGDRHRAGLLFDTLGRCLWEVGDTEGSLAAYRRASELLPDDAPDAARARAMAGEAAALMLVSRYRQSRERAEQAAALAAAGGADRELSNALCTLGVCLSMLGDLDGALVALRRALELAERINNLEEVCRAYTNLSSVLETAGRLDEAADVALTGLDRARRMGLELTGGGVLAGNAGTALYRLGRWPEAETLIDGILPGLTGLMRAHLLQVRAAVLMGRGRYGPAERALAEAEEHSRQVTEAQMVGPLHALRAELALLTRQPRAALAAVHTGLELIGDCEDRQFVVRLCALGLRVLAEEPHAGADPPVEALRLHDQAREGVAYLAEHGAPVPEADADLAECHAELRRLAGGDEAEAWRAAAARWDDLSQPYRAAYARYRQVRAMGSVTGADRRPATATLQEAYEAASRLSADALAAAAGSHARLIRVSLRPPGPARAAGPGEPSTLDVLTAREAQVARELVAGHTNQRIARRLRIAENTVAVHVHNLASKLKVTNRTEAAIRLQQLGVQPPEA